jgi:hypothetical protein
MKHRLMLQSILASAMGLATLLTPARVDAAAKSPPCVVCYLRDGCPDPDESQAVCAALNDPTCPNFVSCMELSEFCPNQAYVAISCGN